jgi:hypothetical protein
VNTAFSAIRTNKITQASGDGVVGTKEYLYEILILPALSSGFLSRHIATAIKLSDKETSCPFTFGPFSDLCVPKFFLLL